MWAHMPHCHGKDGDEMNTETPTPDASRFLPVLVARPGKLWDKHRKYDFGLITHYVGIVSGFREPRFEVWIADTNETRQVFWSEVHKYPFRKHKK